MLSDEWVSTVRRRADQPPLRPREPLMLQAGAAVIGSIEAALGERLAAAGLPLERSEAAWQVVGPADAGLAALAHWLHANGQASRWRNEGLRVDDAAGRAVATIERAAVRPLGITTHAVHLVGRTPDERVWVQQRALDKATDPGVWDTLMGGLVAQGESIATALARETWEEAGLAIDALWQVAPIGQVEVRGPLPDGYMIEHIDCFEATLPPGLQPVNQDGEVERFDCLALPDLCDRLQQGRFTLEASLILAQWLQQRALPPPR